MSSIVITVIERFSEEVFEGLSALLPLLSSSGRSLTRDGLRAVIQSPAAHLHVASDGKLMVGTLTLVLVPIPSGLRGHIEDVVVAKSHRGRGIAKALTQAAIALALQSGFRTIDLTSRPSRVEAIGLYQSLGFRRRDTNVFRYSPNEGN